VLREFATIRNAAYCCEHMHRAGLVSLVCASGCGC